MKSQKTILSALVFVIGVSTLLGLVLSNKEVFANMPATSPITPPISPSPSVMPTASPSASPTTKPIWRKPIPIPSTQPPVL